LKQSLLAIILVLFITLTISAQSDIEQDTTNNIIEKVMDVISINRDTYSITFFPTMDYNQEEGLSLGAFAAIVIKGNEPEIKSKYFRPTTLVPSISYSTKGFLLIESDLIAYTKHNLFIGSRFMIYSMPITYYGIGTPTEEPILFDQETYTIVGSFLKSLNDLYFLGVSYDIGTVSNQPKENTSFDSVPGIKGGTQIGFGIQARIDSRDDILYPSEGLLVDISSMQYFVDYSFNISKIDIRYYRSIASKKNIIALQSVLTVANGNIPFYKLPKLGGQNMLRSINNSNKYINNIVYLSQAEYRRWIWGRFGAVAFVGMGNNLNNWNNHILEGMVFMYGAGMRFRLLEDDKLNFRLDVGMGNGSPSVFMTIREAF